MARSTCVADLIVLLTGETSLGLVYGTNLFKGPKARLPEGAGPFVSIIRTGGLGASRTHNAATGPGYERPTAQIVARATDYDVAEDMADRLYEFMQPVCNRFINGTWWVRLNVRSEPFDLPLDEKQRARQAFNIECEKRVSPATS